MKKQLTLTLLAVATMGSTLLAQDAPKPAGRKKAPATNAASVESPALAEPARAAAPSQTGRLRTASPVKLAPPAKADDNKPKAQAVRAPMQEKIAPAATEAQKSK